MGARAFEACVHGFEQRGQRGQSGCLLDNDDDKSLTICLYRTALLMDTLALIDIKTEKRAQSKQEHVLAVLHNCTNDYMWLSYTVL